MEVQFRSVNNVIFTGQSTKTKKRSKSSTIDILNLMILYWPINVEPTNVPLIASTVSTVVGYTIWIRINLYRSMVYMNTCEDKCNTNIVTENFTSCIC